MIWVVLADVASCTSWVSNCGGKLKWSSDQHMDPISALYLSALEEIHLRIKDQFPKALPILTTSKAVPPTPLLVRQLEGLKTSLTQGQGLFELTQLERTLNDLGHPVIFEKNSQFPVDLDKVLQFLSSTLNLPPETLKIEEIIGEGVINRIFVISSTLDQKKYVLKVLPLLHFWKRRKCENEVFGMELARKALIREKTISVPDVISWETDSTNSPFGREYILMSFAEGELLKQVTDEDIKQEADKLLDVTDKILTSMSFQKMGCFKKDEKGEIVVGADIEDTEYNDGSRPIQHLRRRYIRILQRTKSWITELDRKKSDINSIFPELEKIIFYLENAREEENVHFSELKLTFDHNDLHDGNVLVQLRDNKINVTILDFEWCQAAPTDYEDDSLFGLLWSISMQVYSLTACMRWGVEDIIESQRESMIAIQENLQKMRYLFPFVFEKIDV